MAASSKSSQAMGCGRTSGLLARREEVLRYLGYAGQSMSAKLEGRLDEVMARASGELEASYVWQVHALGQATECGIAVEGTSLVLPGASMRFFLEGATHVGLLAVTMGARANAELMALRAIDPLAQVIYDATCNDLVELGADKAQAEVETWATEHALTCGERFSPGYGDLPLTIQPTFLAALDANRRIGLTTSDSLMLQPTKSVTALVGLYPPGVPTKGRVGCAGCVSRGTCALAARGCFCWAHNESHTQGA